MKEERRYKWRRRWGGELRGSGGDGGKGGMLEKELEESSFSTVLEGEKNITGGPQRSSQVRPQGVVLASRRPAGTWKRRPRRT